MSSIIEGFNYDIFISYRQKDNRHDGWVTEFVNNLKGELESTFKEEISVYFDINPHDGLLETHDVDASLKEKLKCLIFIPVISRTYCDPKSFAWEHEFKTFLEIAEHDRFGLKLKLSGGNIASRILPVQIHELDPDDRKTIEKEIGFLRGIEFIYKAAGVNRPLRASEETPHENLNHTFYRNQVNKVANSIKELIMATKDHRPPSIENNLPDQETIDSFKMRWKIKWTRAYSVALATFLVFSGLMLVFGGRLLRKDSIKLNKGEKISIAVVNFQNNTNDTTLNWLESGISELLRTSLAMDNNELSVQNLQVMGEIAESMKQSARDGRSLKFSKEIAKKLNVTAYITGSFQKYGNNLLTLAKLIDTKSDQVLWAGKTLGDLQKMNTLTDSLSIQLRNFLEIKALDRISSPEYGLSSTSSSEALRAYIKGREYLINQEWENALQQFLIAVKTDSNFMMASFFVANAYDALAVFTNRESQKMKYRKMSAEWTEKTYSNKEKLPEDYRLWLEMWYAYYITKNSQDVVRLCNVISNYDIQSRYLLRDIADTYMLFEKYKDASGIFERIETINESWGEEWKHKPYYNQYARCCFFLGRFNRGNRILQTGLKIFPDDPDILEKKAQYGGWIKDTTLVNKTLSAVAKQQNWTALTISERKAFIYKVTENPDLAEKYYRKAELISGNNDSFRFFLALFLLENGRNVDEGMSIMNDLWNKYPWNNDAAYATALGFLHQGKFASADSVTRILADSTPTASVRLDRLKMALSDSISMHR